jgi:Cu2+-exporting ATPase
MKSTSQPDRHDHHQHGHAPEPRTAQRIVGDRIEDVSISELRVGDLVLVRPGASVPADGVVRDGKSDVNESIRGSFCPPPSPRS